MAVDVRTPRRVRRCFWLPAIAVAFDMHPVALRLERIVEKVDRLFRSRLVFCGSRRCGALFGEPLIDSPLLRAPFLLAQLVRAFRFTNLREPRIGHPALFLLQRLAITFQSGALRRQFVALAVDLCRSLRRLPRFRASFQGA